MAFSCVCSRVSIVASAFRAAVESKSPGGGPTGRAGKAHSYVAVGDEGNITASHACRCAVYAAHDHASCAGG